MIKGLGQHILNALQGDIADLETNYSDLIDEISVRHGGLSVHIYMNNGNEILSNDSDICEFCNKVAVGSDWSFQCRISSPYTSPLLDFIDNPVLCHYTHFVEADDWEENRQRIFGARYLDDYFGGYVSHLIDAGGERAIFKKGRHKPLIVEVPIKITSSHAPKSISGADGSSELNLLTGLRVLHDWRKNTEKEKHLFAIE